MQISIYTRTLVFLTIDAIVTGLWRQQMLQLQYREASFFIEICDNWTQQHNG